MAPARKVRGEGLSSLLPALLALCCTVPRLLGTCQGAPETCPANVCSVTRTACQSAIVDRKQCSNNNCTPAKTKASTENAVAKCGKASDCIKSECDNAVLRGSLGKPFMSGCCCPTCRPRIQTDDPWGPFFSGVPGQNSYATIDAVWVGMWMNECAIINSETDLSSIVVGNGGAKVYSICSSTNALPYNYQIMVDGEGGTGAGMKVVVVDSLGVEHEIVVTGAERMTSVVGFNADTMPTILSIRWNNI